jgi:hypothetical protein
MCYSSRADFGRDTRKDAVRKPEAHREPAPADGPISHRQPVSHSHADDTRLWAFLARRKEPRRKEAHAPGTMQDRIGEKV